MAGKKKYKSYEKWPRFHDPAIDWWNGLSEAQKVIARAHFLKVREQNSKRHVPYPNMYDISHLRLSQLSDKHIVRMHTFKDHKID